MANLKDVARLAGVSISTASRVLREEGYSSPAVREKVERAAESLHYVPNTLARSMRGRPTRMISFLVYDILNPFFANLAEGVEDAAHEHGFTVVLCSTHHFKEADRERKYMQTLVQLQIDGIILQHRFANPEYYQQLLERQGIPAVGLVSPKPGFVSDLVRCDTTEASRTMVNHLAALGHKRIAAIGPSMPSTLGGERHQGYLLGLQDSGIATDERLMKFEGWRTRDGYNMTYALLEQGKPDAIFAFGPRLAAGAAHALRESKLRVPHDIALVCVDDFGMGSELDPFMTVVCQPEREMGQRAANLLIERIQGRYSGEPREIVLPASVLIRRSCGATLAQDNAHANGSVTERPPHVWEDDTYRTSNRWPKV